jgi:hypothetical protein
MNIEKVISSYLKAAVISCFPINVEVEEEKREEGLIT